jgi:glucose-1-phosphate adenylyltransferase
MGIYIFKRSLLFELLRSELKEATDFGKEIIPACIDRYRVASYQYSGYWTDIGNISSFFEANIELTQEIPAFDMFDSDRTIYTRSRMLPPAKISGTTLTQVLVAEGCIINASLVKRSVIGIRSRIGLDSQISDTYIMGSDYYETLQDIAKGTEKGVPPMGIGQRCQIQRAIIDKNCRIGNDVTIVGGDHLENKDHPLYAVKDGIVVVKKGAIIPDGFVI